MTFSRLRVAKSETRDLAERDHLDMVGLRFGAPTAWRMSNGAFFTAFVAIAAVLAALALLLR